MISGLLQLQPSERTTVHELGCDPWVVVAGDLPAEVVVEAPKSPGSHTGPRRGLGLGQVWARVAGLACGHERPVLGLVYSVLVGGALIASQISSDALALDDFQLEG